MGIREETIEKILNKPEVIDTTDYPVLMAVGRLNEDLSFLLGAEGMEEVARLAQSYLDDGVIPMVKRNDAEHIAYAVVYEIDILVSWNYRHLANVNKERRVNLVNQREGYFYPFRMVTPLEVMGYGD